MATHVGYIPRRFLYLLRATVPSWVWNPRFGDKGSIRDCPQHGIGSTRIAYNDLSTSDFNRRAQKSAARLYLIDSRYSTHHLLRVRQVCRINQFSVDAGRKRVDIFRPTDSRDAQLNEQGLLNEGPIRIAYHSLS